MYNISPKYIALFVVFIAAFFGYNAFLAVRDQKMFDAYYNTLKCEDVRELYPNCKE